jgi:hypothetical protein
MAKDGMSDIPSAAEFGQMRSYMARIGIGQSTLNGLLGTQVNGRTWRMFHHTLTGWANGLPQAQAAPVRTVSRARGLARIPQAARSIVRSPAVATMAAVSLFVSVSALSQESVSMEFLDAVLGLFPVVAAAAILVRYIVEGVKKFAPKSIFAQYPDRTQAGLNAFFWLVLGVAAIYGAEAQALEVVERFTDAFPGILGLLELVIPVFLSLLATKGVHELAKRTEGSPFRGSERGQPI